MAECKMEDTKEVCNGANDTAVVNGNAMVTETEKAIEGSPLIQMETDVHSEESLLSSEESPRAIGKEELASCQNDQNPVDRATLLLEDRAQPHVHGLELHNNDYSLEEQCLVKPPGAGVVQIADVADNTLNLYDEGGWATSPNKQSDSSAPNEKSVETKVTVDKGEETNDGVVMMESPTGSGTKEDLDNELTTMELPLDSKKEDEECDGVTKMELLQEAEIMEENLSERLTGVDQVTGNEVMDEFFRPELDVRHDVEVKTSNKSFLLEPHEDGVDESGTEEEQAAFMKELETFHKERCLEFKPPRFYGEPLNCLKLWRAVVRLGGYEQVTSCKLWRQVGESFKPPKTCTTVSWTFRCFYEKALLEYEKYKMRIGELPFTDASFTEPAAGGNQASLNQGSGSGRARRDAAARAMQGWHSQRLLGNGEVGDPIIKDKNSSSMPKREKQFKSIGLLKRKKPSPVERAVKVARMKASKPQLDTMVVDIGPPADWVKINVQRTKDCFEVYALVPGLLREEVRVQSDPAGRLVISGQPEQLDNPWGVTPFKKIVSLPSRIDPHQTSAVVTLHGQLFVRVPFEQLDL